MAKQIRFIDNKLERVVSIIEMSADEILQAANEAGQLIQQVNKGISDINTDLQQEVISPEDAKAKYDTDIAKLRGKLANRFKRMNKNTKAIASLLGAVKAMDDEEKE